MIQLFRKFFSSKVGIAVTLAFLGLIAIAFASADISGVGSVGGFSSEQRIADVGEREVTSREVSMSASAQVQGMRQQNPTLTMETFIAQGGFDDMLDQMIRRTALAAFAEDMGLRAGNKLVDSEIIQLPGFTDLEGNFDSELFRANLRQRGLSEEAVRDDLAKGLLVRQMGLPVTAAVQMPRGLAQRYAQLLGERRKGRIAALPAAAYAPEGDPSEKQLQAYYKENSSNYIRPERRVLRYALLTNAALADIAAPTEQQIARRYERDRLVYQESESRVVTQLIVPTEAAAQAVIDEVRSGVPLEQSARSKGYDVQRMPLRDRATIAGNSSEAVAEAAFAANEGALAAPARSNLGWTVQRVDRIAVQAGQSLDQARATIREQLASEDRTRALNEATSRIEDLFADGRNLSEVAKEFGIEIVTTRPLTAAGNIYGTPEPAPAELAPVLQVAFEMDEAEPQLAETNTPNQYLLFDVSRITESATAPLAEIREDVTLQWRRDEGMRLAGEAAKRVLAKIGKDSSLAEALAAEKVSLPPPFPVNSSREEMAASGQIPRPLMLMFSMAEGTAKRLEEDASSRWFVVELDDIETPELAANDPIVAGARGELSQTLSQEYLAQFIAAAQAAVETERNESAIEALKAQLTGQSG